jgi:cytochrome c-type biogenesis protein CcmF
VTLTGVGPAALVVGLAAAAGATAAGAAGRSRLAAWATAGAFGGLSVALVALVAALVGNDGSLTYVADHTSRATSGPYRVAGLWGGMAGSLLLWAWLASVWAVATGAAVRRRAAELAGVTQAVLAANVAVLCALLVSATHPFARLAVPAIDGGGLNPVLLHPAMLYHPPLLYAGAVGLAAPFALAVAGLSCASQDRWLPLAARFAGVSLVLLSAGLLAGAHWAYVELGWGGYWSWDPVENGGLLPWLAAVAFLHAAVSARRGRGSARAAGALAGLAFALGLLGAFLTRSGATGSVHAFAEARTVGQILAGTLAVTLLGMTVLVVRAPRVARPPAVAPLTKAGALVANNVLLVGTAVAVGFGTLYAVVVRWVTGDRVVVTGRYFAVVAAPLAVVLLALLGAGPRMRWGTVTRWRQLPGRLSPGAAGVLAAGVAAVALPEPRPLAVLLIGLAGASAALTVAGWRQAGGAPWRVAHLGVAVVLAGVAGTTTGAHVTASLAPGQELSVRGRTVRLEEIVPVAAPDRGRAAEARIVLRPGVVLRPQAVLSATGQRVSVAALHSTPRADVQVALRAVSAGGQVAVVDVNVLPLVQLVWWGGLLVVAGLGLGLRQSGRRAAKESPPADDEPSAYPLPTTRRKVTLSTRGPTTQ